MWVNVTIMDGHDPISCERRFDFAFAKKSTFNLLWFAEMSTANIKSFAAGKRSKVIFNFGLRLSFLNISK